MTLSYGMDYTGKLDTAKCKQLILDLIGNLDDTELSDELSELDEDAVEQVRLKNILTNIKYWKRENKVLITEGEVEMFKRILRIDIPVHNTGYVRNFSNDELPARATVYQLSSDRVFIELEVG